MPLAAARIKVDTLHRQKMMEYLKSHNPFAVSNDDCLVNISTGVVAHDRVNVDRAQEIGRRINDAHTGKQLGQVSFKKCDQVVTFASMKKSVTLADSSKIHISSAELRQRLIAIASTQNNLNRYSIPTSCRLLLQPCSRMTD